MFKKYILLSFCILVGAPYTFAMPFVGDSSTVISKVTLNGLAYTDNICSTISTSYDSCKNEYQFIESCHLKNEPQGTFTKFVVPASEMRSDAIVSEIISNCSNHNGTPSTHTFANGYKIPVCILASKDSDGALTEIYIAHVPPFGFVKQVRSGPKVGNLSSIEVINFSFAK